jgi:hypothetical protein
MGLKLRAPDIALVRAHRWRSRRSIILRSAASLFGRQVVTMRQTWMKLNYVVAIGVATIGWLCFIGWMVTNFF